MKLILARIFENENSCHALPQFPLRIGENNRNLLERQVTPFAESAEIRAEFCKDLCKAVKQLKLKCTHISDKFNQLFVVVVTHFVESRGGQIEN